MQNSERAGRRLLIAYSYMAECSRSKQFVAAISEITGRKIKVSFVPGRSIPVVGEAMSLEPKPRVASQLLNDRAGGGQFT